MSALGITIILAMVLAAGVFLLFTIINNILVCPPSEVLIFFGSDAAVYGWAARRLSRDSRWSGDAVPLIETKTACSLPTWRLSCR